MPLPGPLDYAVPDGMALEPGDFVQVEVGKRAETGVVWGPGDQAVREDRIKPVVARLDVPPMRAEMRAFLDRAAAYTMTPPGMMLRLATRVPDLGGPAPLRKVWRRGTGEPARMTPARARVLEVADAAPGFGFGATELAREAGVSVGVIDGLAACGALISAEVPRDGAFPELDAASDPGHLSPVQAGAAERLVGLIEARDYQSVLLKGVTGSGKTEVYLEAVAACLRQGRQALVLLPEIALTEAFLGRVEARFGARPAEWHHDVQGAERRRVWHAVAKGDAQLVVGARSALFLPFRDLGCVVIDEEHEGSYKQGDVVLYHARDMAVLRASLEGAVAILASATPSLETWANADAGKYVRLDLPERFGAAVLPQMRLVDMRLDGPDAQKWISPPLERAIRRRMAEGEQSLLFLNRRGYAPLTLCRSCGHRFGCPVCDTWLVEHRYRARLMCHQCGHTEPVPTACPECGRDDRLAVCGPGVERLAEETAALFPTARVEVLSSDLTGGTQELKARFARVAAGEADIVIGTQLVAKGHNFPLLTLVGVVDADLGLQGGDLRAAEKTFQLVRQVAGRAGRAEKPGSALIQTANPEHPVMQAIVSGDDEAFWRQEADARRHAGVPPYGRMAGIILSGTDEARVWEAAIALSRASGPIRAANAELYGPTLAPIGRIRGRVRVRMLVKAPKGAAIQQAIAEWTASVKVPSSVRIIVDVDPYVFL